MLSLNSAITILTLSSLFFCFVYTRRRLLEHNPPLPPRAISLNISSVSENQPWRVYDTLSKSLGWFQSSVAKRSSNSTPFHNHLPLGSIFVLPEIVAVPIPIIHFFFRRSQFIVLNDALAITELFQKRSEVIFFYSLELLPLNFGNKDFLRSSSLANARSSG